MKILIKGIFTKFGRKKSNLLADVERNTQTRHKSFYIWLSVCMLVLGLTACETASYEIEPTRTLLFYMGGDNNLSSEVETKIDRIKKAELSPYCRVLIYADVRGRNPQLYQLVREKQEVTLVLVQEYAECNSADADVFSAVLQEVIVNFSAPSYGLVLFSHASGWLPEGAYMNPSSYGKDKHTRSVLQDGDAEMEIPAFAAAIPNNMFDFVIFEACFMASVEVAYELKDITKYIVASSAELISPGFTDCYAQALPHLYKETPDLLAFCQEVEQDYATREGYLSNLTLSLINTSSLDNLAEAVKNLNGYPVPPAFSMQAFDRKGGTLFFDLADRYAQSEEHDFGALKSAIEECVVWKASTPSFLLGFGGFAIASHCGLTTYVEQSKYPLLNRDYIGMKWHMATSTFNQ